MGPDRYEFDDDPDRVDIASAWAYLGTEAYWGRWRDQDDLTAQVRSSWRVVGCYVTGHGAMVGFARAISDGADLAYLADVYVLAAHRGLGLGEQLVHRIIEDGPGRGFRWLLHTRDAHGLYARFGFAAPPETLLERPSRRSPRPAEAAIGP